MCHFLLKVDALLLQTSYCDRQLSENIRTYNCPNENAQTRKYDLRRGAGADAVASHAQHGRVNRRQILMKNA